MYVGTIAAGMTFCQAIEFYLEWRTAPLAPSLAGSCQYVGNRTLKDYHQKAKTLKKFFGAMPLDTIHVWHLKEYQKARLTADGFTRAYGERIVPSPASGNKINDELELLKKLMRMAMCWTPDLEMYYKPFRGNQPEVQRALSLEEQSRFLSTAAKHPRWHPVWWYALVAIHLTFSSDEMRTLRIGDINMPFQLVTVNPHFGKNVNRRRTNSVEDGAVLWALQNLIDRAADLCRSNPEYKPGSPHYFLFPRRLVRYRYAPDLPMGETGLRKPFDEVCVASELEWFPFNGFRHTGATRLAERNVPRFILKKRMGQISEKVLDKYVQIGEQAERIEMKKAFEKKPSLSVVPQQFGEKVSSY